MIYKIISESIIGHFVKLKLKEYIRMYTCL